MSKVAQWAQPSSVWLRSLFPGRFQMPPPGTHCPPGAKRSLHLFDVQEVLGLEGDGHSLHRHLIPRRRVVADIGPNSKCHRLGLEEAQGGVTTGGLDRHVKMCSFLSGGAVMWRVVL